MTDLLFRYRARAIRIAITEQRIVIPTTAESPVTGPKYETSYVKHSCYSKNGGIPFSKVSDPEVDSIVISGSPSVL